MQYPGKSRIGGKKAGIGDFHHLVGNRRDDGAIAAVDDVGEPVTIVLNEGAIAVFEGALGSEKEDRDRHLEDSDDEAGAKRLGRSGDPVHNAGLWKGRGKWKGRGNARLFQRSFGYII